MRINKSDVEVLYFLIARDQNRLTKTRQGKRRVRHQKAFDYLREQGLTCLDKSSVWCLTIEGFEYTRVMRTVLLENGIKPDPQPQLRGDKRYYNSIIEAKRLQFSTNSRY